MWNTYQNSDPFDNLSKIEEEEYTYPWNNEQLNFDIIGNIMTNEEKKSDFEILISEDIVLDEEENNNTHIEHKENENVIHLVKIDLNNGNEHFKKKRDK